MDILKSSKYQIEVNLQMVYTKHSYGSLDNASLVTTPDESPNVNKFMLQKYLKQFQHLVMHTVITAILYAISCYKY